MDLNYFYKRHQLSLFMAENGASETVRRIHHEFGERYAARIAAAKLRPLGASAA